MMEQCPNKTVVRTNRGLSIKGTRITLYQFMDYLTTGQSWKLVREDFPQLTEQQLNDAQHYIETHYAEVEAEYQLVLQQAQEIEAYWRAFNQDIRLRIAQEPPKPSQEKIWTKLQAQKTQLDLAL